MKTDSDDTNTKGAKLLSENPKKAKILAKNT